MLPARWLTSSSTTRTQEVILSTLLGLLTIPEAARAVMLLNDLQPIYNCIPGCLVAHQVVLYSFVHGCPLVPERVQRHMQELVEFIGFEIGKWEYDAQVSGLDTLQKLFRSLETQVATLSAMICSIG